MSLTLLFGMMAAAVLGAVGHEVAHWIIWKLAGRNPRLDLWGLAVNPRAGSRHVTPADRVAAAAPYVVGLSAVVWGATVGSVLWVVFGLGMIQIPSPVDVATILGRVKWRIAGDQ